MEDDQLSCTQESNENYFADTEDCSSVSSLRGELFVFNHVI